MELPVNKLLFCAAIAIAALALPAAAGAESVVPPENSAATQYTEAIPTGGGQQNAEGGHRGKNRSPSSVLGSKKAKKLEAQGPQGHAAAQLAAETAPPPAQPSGEAAPQPSPGTSASASPPRSGASSDEASSNPGKGNRGNARRGVPSQPAAAARPPLDASDGSSGLGEVLGQATGSSSDGELGLLLPLLVLGMLVWALAYGLRRKRPLS